MKKILLVEDDKNLSSQIESYLKEYEYQIDLAKSFKEGLFRLEGFYDLAILDMNLPDKEGIGLLEICKKKNIKAIILTVKNDEKFIVKALDGGAYDYITKPFKLAILRARIDKALRMKLLNDNKEITFKDLSLDKEKGIIYYKGEEVDLTSLEYQVVSLFIKNPNRIFTRDYLLERFWDSREKFVNDNTLTTTIKRIRAKMDKNVIKTIRGIGYRMD